jgi:hypothetical protein
VNLENAVPPNKNQSEKHIVGLACPLLFRSKSCLNKIEGQAL